MKNKLGVLTFHNVENYGAYCQAFSLQKWLSDRNINTEIVDYRNEKISKPWSFSALKTKGLIKYLLGLAYYAIRMLRRPRFDKARKKLNISRRISKEQMKDLQYAGYIVGSDQVWNFDITNSDTTYLLDFCGPDALRFSYAASFGFDTFEAKNKSTYLGYLRNFDLLLVRELSAKLLLQDSGLKDASHVLDPVFLHSKDDWLKYVEKPKTNREYNLIYQVTVSQNLIKFARNLAKFNKFKFESIPFPIGGLIKSNINLTAGPFEWLGLINNAKCVITDSFHGVAFCIILNKPFKVVLEGAPTRIISLLNSLDLSCHIVKAEDIQKEITVSDFEYDWTSVNNKVQAMRTESELHLHKIKSLMA